MVSWANAFAVIKIAAVEVTSTAQITKNNPESGGLYDPAMGPIAYTYDCGSCRKSVNNCPGHNGFYRLKYPLIQHLTSKFVIKFLNIICIRCFKIILDPDIKYSNGTYYYPEFHDGSLKNFEQIQAKILKKIKNA